MSSDIVSSQPAAIPEFGVPANRIAGYDLARALALLGMIFVNFRYQMQADEYGAPWLLKLANLIDGRPAVTFVILAGAGLSLLNAYSRKTNGFHPLQKPCSTILKRSAFLFIIGLLFTRIWHADILHFYGFYFAVAVLLVNASGRILLIISIALLGASFLLSLQFNFITLPKIESVWDPNFWTQKGFLEDLFVTGCYPVFPWMVYFLIGMWLGRQNLADTRLQKRILQIAVFGLLSSEALAWVVGHVLISESYLDKIPLIVLFQDTDPFSSSLLAIFSAGGTALVVIVLCTIVAEKAGRSRWMTPFLATARMTLTLYLAHIGICQLFLIVIDRYDMEQPLIFAWLCAAVFCIMTLSFANLWISRYGQGPFEKLMRWVSA
jgi:uncharacterized membrane protein YeiB